MPEINVSKKTRKVLEEILPLLENDEIFKALSIMQKRINELSEEESEAAGELMILRKELEKSVDLMIVDETYEYWYAG